MVRAFPARSKTLPRDIDTVAEVFEGRLKLLQHIVPQIGSVSTCVTPRIVMREQYSMICLTPCPPSREEGGTHAWRMMLASV